MNVLNQIDHIGSAAPKASQDACEAVLMECSRVIHAAVISRRFLSTLLTDPLKSIEDGYCGEKFAFTHEEKQQIRQIHAASLAEFSTALVQAVRNSYCIPAASEMAFAQLEKPTELPA